LQAASSTPTALLSLFEHGVLLYLYDLSGSDDINRYWNQRGCVQRALGGISMMFASEVSHVREE
jgi:hypothetical protein